MNVFAAVSQRPWSTSCAVWVVGCCSFYEVNLAGKNKLTHLVENFRSVFFSLILLPVGRCCKTFKFHVAQATKSWKTFESGTASRHTGEYVPPLFLIFVSHADLYKTFSLGSLWNAPYFVVIFKSGSLPHKHTQIYPVQPYQHIQLIGRALWSTIRECSSLIKASRTRAPIHCLSKSP